MNIPVKNCSSCGACANSCAHGAISMRLDKEGFYRPVIDSSKCVKCGLCEKVCPWEKEVFNPNGSTKAPRILAAYAQDDEIRLQSSSGGIFTVLAEKILDDGGVVVGVAQLSSTRFGHIIVDNKADLAKLRGSKYVQADVGFIYRDVRALLKNGRKVLFSGSPCQVAGLYSVLGGKGFDNLWTVDVVCHGTPSVKVFEKYIRELEFNTSAFVLSSNFRDKHEGWRNYSLKSQLKSDFGKEIIYSRNLNEDSFLQIFLRNICLNKSCADCHYGKLPRIADITLGDYWNIADIHPKMDDNKGTSVVLLNTNHGEKLFSFVSKQINCCESSLENAVAGNPCIVCSSRENFRRPEFFADLNQLSMDKLAEKFSARLPLYRIVLLKIRNYLLSFLQ